jgi:hypothetical protein
MAASMSLQKITRPVAQYLDEFGSEPFVAGLGEASQDAADVKLPDEPAVADPSVLLLAAREEGFGEGRAAANAEYETQITRERLAFEAQLAAERQRWAGQEGETLSGAIKASFVEVESNIAASVERILTPFVVDAMRRRMVELLTEHINVLLGGSERPIIAIHGPEDLLAKLRDKLDASACAIAFSPDFSIYVQIVAGQTMIESRIGAWLERIKSLPE